MIIFDEFGNRWRCKGGDPAMRLVNRLKRSRYELVVLPLATLASGHMTSPATIPDDVIRATRLNECIEVLSSSS